MVSGTVPCPGRSHDDGAVVSVPGVSLDPSTETVRVPLAEVLPLAGETAEPVDGVVAVGDGRIGQRLAGAADGDGLGGGSGPAQSLLESEIGGTQGQRPGGHIQRDGNVDGAVGHGRAVRARWR